MSNKSCSYLLSAILAGLVVLTGAGCKSTGEPGDASFAAVRIQNHSVDQIATITLKVFGEEGFTGGMTGQNTMVFERAASRGATYAREGFVAGYYGAQTVYRVKAAITPLAGGTIRLHCKAYAITGGSDPFFQDEVPLSNAKSGKYQKLLDKVAAQLK
jgi:hypothetical protein